MLSQQGYEDFLTVAAALGATREAAFHRARDIAEERPDDVPDLGAIYLRVLAEIAERSRV